MLMVAKAKSDSLKQVGASLTRDGSNAASLSVAEQYVQAFKALAKTGNTIILPADAANVAGTVAQAFQVYKSIAADGVATRQRSSEKRDRAEYDSGSDLDK